MSIDAGSRTIGNRAESKEAGIRLSVYAEMRTSGADVTGFLDIFATAVIDEIWTKLRDQQGNVLTFAQFIEAPMPVGIGVSFDQIRKIVKLRSRHESNPETAARLATMRAKVETLAREMVPEVNANGTNQRGGFDISNPPPSGQGGTSRDYTIARLKRDCPDLAEMVVSGELTANQAAIEAGFRKRATPLDTLRKAWGKANQDERAAFLAEVRD